MKKLCIIMSAVVAIGLVATPQVSMAAKKATLKTKKMTVNVGAKKKITIKNKAASAKYTYVSSKKKIASVNKKGVVTGKKAGSAKITIKERNKNKVRKLGVIKVTVKRVEKDNTSVNTSTATPIVTNTTAPVVTNAPATVSPLVTDAPVETVQPTKAPTRAPLVVDDTDTPSGFDTKQDGVSYGSISKVTYYSNTVGKDRNLNVLTPPDYDINQKYPVLYLCHGGNGDEGDWLSGNPQYILGNLIASGEAKHMIIVMVNCRARMNDGANPSDSLSQEHMDAWTNFLYELQDDVMPYIEENYPVLTGRENTAIAGLSMGGRESLYIGFSIPEKISYIGAFSPAFGIFEYENWGLYEKGYFTEETFTFSEEYMENTTCMIMNGSNDSMVRDEPMRYHNALVANGVNHYYYEIPGDHNMDVWMNGLYHFLKIAFQG